MHTNCAENLNQSKQSNFKYQKLPNTFCVFFMSSFDTKSVLFRNKTHRSRWKVPKRQRSVHISSQEFVKKTHTFQVPQFSANC